MNIEEIKNKFNELIIKLNDYKNTLIGTPYDESDFPFMEYHILKGEEDGCDTDLHYCSISLKEEIESNLCFLVEVNPIDNKILDINTDCTDVWVDENFIGTFHL